MEKRKVDVAIIGIATAGLNAYRAAKQAGVSCVVIDKGPLGTTCARVGCMPSKLLIAAADAYYHFHQAEEFGFELNGEVKILGERVMKRVQSIRDEFVSGVMKKIETVPEEDKITGSACFIDLHTLIVDDHTQIEANAIVIATGGETYIPPILKRAEERLLTNEEIFELPTVPESLFVVGMGLIGIELGQAFSRLGTRAVLLDLFRVIAGLTDPEIFETAFDIFGSELHLVAPAEIVSVEKLREQVKVTYRGEDGQTQEECFEYILCAAGRPPQIKGLGLEKTALPLDKYGMPLYNPETCQCGDSHIFMAGDVTGKKQVLHEAVDEGNFAGSNAACFPDVAAFKRRTPLTVVFTDPQITAFGKTFKDFGEEGPAFMATIDFQVENLSRMMNINRGLGHLYVDTDGTLLGGEIIGPRAENLGHLLAWIAQRGLKVNEILEMPFYHPAFEEGIKDALQDLQAKIDFPRANG